jgi:hypothetical protein
VDQQSVRRRDLRVAPEKKKRKVLVPFLAGLGVAALVPVIGSTLAANISLGNSSIEFGQGQISTTTCDDSITVTPTSSWNGEAFSVNTVDLSGIADACNGKTLTVSATTSSGTTALGDFVYNKTGQPTDNGSHSISVTGLSSQDVTGFILESSDS